MLFAGSADQALQTIGFRLAPAPTQVHGLGPGLYAAKDGALAMDVSSDTGAPPPTHEDETGGGCPTSEAGSMLLDVDDNARDGTTARLVRLFSAAVCFSPADQGSMTMSLVR